MKDLLDSLSSDVADVLIAAVREVADLRERIAVPGEESDLDGIHHALVANRKLIERLEHLTATLILIRSRAGKAQANARVEYETAYAEAATKKTVGFGDFTTAKEKDASFSLAAITESMKLHKAENFYRDVDSSWDYCRVLLRGAEGAQRDLETRLRITSLRASLGG